MYESTPSASVRSLEYECTNFFTDSVEGAGVETGGEYEGGGDSEGRV